MILFQFIGFSQSINTTIGNCETINLTQKRFNNVAFWFYSINGSNWISFGFTQAEYNNGLTLNLDQMPGILSLDPFGDVLTDPLNPKDPILTTKPFTGTLYIKGEIFENVISDPFAPDGLGSYSYYLKQLTDCSKLNASIPSNMPQVCNVAALLTPIYTYDVIPCSPSLDGVPLVEQPTCSYKNDGKVTFTFGRDLVTGERLDLNLIQIVNSNELTPLVKTFDTSNFLDRKVTYDNLQAGTYLLRYQTFQNNGSVATSTKDKSFTIDPAVPLTYEIAGTNLKCNNSDDGTIVITVLSGIGPYKFYQDGIQVFPELITGKYYLKGLKAKLDEYTILVIDKNKCIEK